MKVATAAIEVLPTATIREAMQKLEASEIKIILVVDEDRKLIGTCTDGDFRRAIIETGSTRVLVKDVGNMNPVSVVEGLNPGKLENLLLERNVEHIPIVDDEGYLKGLFVENKKPIIDELKVPIVLMAGGLGRRLMPLTETCPKPLLPLGDKPILEHIITRFRDQGYSRFYISVNYLGHMIEKHFGNGRDLSVEISYLRENIRLGTGGALDLLPRNMKFPFLVMNGDLITDLNYDKIVRSHIESGASATMCVREYRTHIPFGVVKFEGHKYLGTDEKPTFTHHINAGIYCISQDAVEKVPSGEFYDMPTLFEDLMQDEKTCGVYVMRDTWIDIGNPREYESAQKRFASPARSEEEV